MNDNNLNQNAGTYKATTNLNTAIDNPQINVNSATGVNVQDLGYNNYVESNNQGSDNFTSTSFSVNNNSDNSLSNINSNSASNLNSNVNNNVNVNTGNNPIENTGINSSIGISNNSVESTNSTVVNTENTSNANYTYTPTLEGKKMEQKSVVSSMLHSGEFKALILIVFVLFLFLLVMPSIYDLIRKIKLMR